MKRAFTIAGRVRLVVAGLALLLAAPARGEQAPRDVTVLAVGVNRYKHEVGNLQGAVGDANGVSEVFQKLGRRPRVGGLTAAAGTEPAARPGEVRKFNVRVETLVNSQATRTAILDGMDEIAEKAKPGSLVVFYLSGHGGREGGVFYFLPHDFDPRTGPASGVRALEILRRVDELAARGCRVLVVLDACHAGQFRHNADRLLAKYPAGARGGVVVLTSCVPAQLSADGSSNGLFTEAFLEGLRGAANADRDGFVTLKEVNRYLGWRMKELIRERGKLPGLAWSEQDFQCDYSASVSESLELVPAEASVGPRLPKADGPARLPDEKMYAGEKRPVGVWKLPGEGDRSAGYTLTLRADGTFTARLRQKGGREVWTEGRYRYAKGQPLELVYGNGIDRLALVEFSGDRIKLADSPSHFVVLERVN